MRQADIPWSSLFHTIQLPFFFFNTALVPLNSGVLGAEDYSIWGGEAKLQSGSIQKKGTIWVPSSSILLDFSFLES